MGKSAKNFEIVFDSELSALPTVTDQSKNSTHILSFTVPSSVAAQIGEANQ